MKNANIGYIEQKIHFALGYLNNIKRKDLWVRLAIKELSDILAHIEH